MHDIKLGVTSVIANPAAHSGAGERAAAITERFFAAHSFLTSAFYMYRTEGPGNARDIAAAQQHADTVIALGGDGLIHEVAGGLMRIPAQARPRLAVIAMGSGNDFARTLNLTRNDPETAVTELVHGKECPLDLGVVDRGTPRETYFVETLSFGLDAAIALDTTHRRAARTRQKGAGLFATSGIKILSQAHNGWRYQAKLCMEGGQRIAFDGTEIIFAIQNGPTYGGGFPITPDACPSDGLLDVCWNTRIPCVPATLGTFGLVRLARHTHLKLFAFARATHIDIVFPETEPPAQVDGERLSGSHHTIDIAPSALRVIVHEKGRGK